MSKHISVNGPDAVDERFYAQYVPDGVSRDALEQLQGYLARAYGVAPLEAGRLHMTVVHIGSVLRLQKAIREAIGVDIEYHAILNALRSWADEVECRMPRAYAVEISSLAVWRTCRTCAVVALVRQDEMLHALHADLMAHLETRLSPLVPGTSFAQLAANIAQLRHSLVLTAHIGLARGVTEMAVVLPDGFEGVVRMVASPVRDDLHDRPHLRREVGLG